MDGTKRVKEEDEDEQQGQREEEEGGGETSRFGRFLLRVKDSQEKDGFTITDMEIQVQPIKAPLNTVMSL